jgi:hypothetical protein
LNTLRAALGHEVDRQTRRLHGDVAAAVRHLDLSNESKLKYDGEEFDDRSVIDPPSRFHCTFALVPRDVEPTCWPDADPPTLSPPARPGSC